jgi:hypothetical protein
LTWWKAANAERISIYTAKADPSPSVNAGVVEAAVLAAKASILVGRNAAGAGGVAKVANPLVAMTVGRCRLVLPVAPDLASHPIRSDQIRRRRDWAVPISEAGRAVVAIVRLKASAVARAPAGRGVRQNQPRFGGLT